MNLRGILPFAHDTLRKVVRSGDYVVDATCGNGHDTLLLAELVGVNGHVLGFDIQQLAIDATLESIGHLMELLEVGGVIILVIYHGHPAGKQEKDAVMTFCEAIPQQDFHVLSYNFINQKNDAPFVIVIEKRKPRQS